MLSASFPGGSTIDLIDVPMPELMQNEVLLKVWYCGVCGSDKKVFRNGIAVIPGHEVSGVVVESRSSGVPVGTRAAAYLPVVCGECRYCRDGYTNRCIERKALLGWSPPWHGGYAEYMRLPAANIIAIEDSVDAAAAVLLLDTVGTAFHAIRMGNVRKEDKVLVVGCGPLGLGVVAGLKAFGVADYTATDLFDFRMHAAQELGASTVSADSAGELADVDVIIEVTGVADNIRRSLRQVNQGGKVILVGEWEAPWEFEHNGQIILKDFSVIRSWYFPMSEFDENQQMLLDGRVNSESLVSHVYSLTEIGEAFDQFLSGNSRKILVGPGEER